MIVGRAYYKITKMTQKGKVGEESESEKVKKVEELVNGMKVWGGLTLMKK